VLLRHASLWKHLHKRKFKYKCGRKISFLITAIKGLPLNFEKRSWTATDKLHLPLHYSLFNINNAYENYITPAGITGTMQDEENLKRIKYETYH
jgi:hypothetical protein